MLAGATRSWALSPRLRNRFGVLPKPSPKKAPAFKGLGPDERKRSGRLTALSSAPNLLRRVGTCPTVAGIRPHGVQRSPRDSVERTDTETNYPSEQMLCPLDVSSYEQKGRKEFVERCGSKNFRTLLQRTIFRPPFFDSKFGSRFGMSFWGYSTLDVVLSQQAVLANFSTSRTV